MSSNYEDEALVLDNAQHIEALKIQVTEGGRAAHFLSTTEWGWFRDTILVPLQDEAMETLKKARTDEDRVKAQQMLLAADKPKQILNGLVKQGEAAELQLRSTRQNTGG